MKRTALIIVLLGLYINTFSQKGMDTYDKNYYCMVGYLHPQSVIESYNNWELLMTLKGGKSITELNKSGVKYSKNQIEILRLLNFVELKEDKYYSTISILNENETNELRLETKIISNNIVNLINKDYNSFQQILTKQGFKNNVYTLLFSYVMDNLVWDKLEKLNYKTMRELTVEQPFWSGTLWFMNSKRKFSCGTNSMSFDSIENTKFCINWSKNSGVSFSNFNIIESMLKDFKKNAIVTDTVVKNVLKAYDLCNTDGLLKFPVIKNDSTNELNHYSNIIANIITNYLVNNIDYNQVLKKYKIKDKEVAIIILFHEIMWDILDILEEKGQLKKPIAFSDPKNSKKTDLKDLIYIIE